MQQTAQQAVTASCTCPFMRWRMPTRRLGCDQRPALAAAPPPGLRPRHIPPLCPGRCRVVLARFMRGWPTAVAVDGCRGADPVPRLGNHADTCGGASCFLLSASSALVDKPGGAAMAGCSTPSFCSSFFAGRKDRSPHAGVIHCYRPKPSARRVDLDISGTACCRPVTLLSRRIVPGLDRSRLSLKVIRH